MENPEGFEVDKQTDIPVKASVQPVVKETPKPATIYLVDNINKYDTGAPSSANNIGLSENHFHINCPLI